MMAAPSVPKKPMDAHHGMDYPLRTQSMRSTTALIVCLVLLLTVVVGGYVATYFQRENIRRTELLQREGVVTKAKVVALEIVKDSEGSWDRYFVTYTFVNQPGSAEEREITRQDMVPYYLYRQLTEGSGIEVIYARNSPELACITAEYSPGFASPVPALIGAAVVLPSLAALFLCFIRYRDAVRLEEQGMAVMVEVLDLYEETDNEGTCHYIAYQLPGSAPFRHTVSIFVYKKLLVGDQVAIRYLPDQPRLFRLVSGKDRSRETPAQKMNKTGKSDHRFLRADREIAEDPKWIPEDPNKQWECPRCSQSNPNNTLKCEKRGYSLI